jgi:hypothetical protein
MVVGVWAVTSMGSPDESVEEKMGIFLDFPGASTGPENGLRGEGSASLLITMEMKGR